jgi:YXWGXW repeat-containing protein
MKKLAVLFIAISSILGVTKINAQDASLSITVAPPELPVYAQPPCNYDGYLWSPGYWAYGSDGYYWVPGVWVDPPEEGVLWTPGYWGYANGFYGWNVGYWGPTVGYYGGVCYGYGYGGDGFYGGRWQGSHFQYNTAAWHVNGGVIHNTYVDRTVINNTGTRYSFNGPGGVTRTPNEHEQAASKADHHPITAAQQSHHQSAIANKNQKSTANHGAPATMARTKVGGDRYNAAGHSVSTIHSTPAPSHAAATPASHFANPVHASTPGAQQRPAAQPQHSQPRPAQQPQHNNAPGGGMQRQSQPARAPSGGGGGGQRGGGGGAQHGGGGGKH